MAACGGGVVGSRSCSNAFSIACQELLLYNAELVTVLFQTETVIVYWYNKKGFFPFDDGKKSLYSSLPSKN